MSQILMRHPEFVSDLVDLEGFTQANFAYTATAAQTAAVLDEGVYDVWSDQDCYIKVATTASDVTTATGYLLRQNNTITFIIRKNRNIGAIRSSANGTLYYHKIG